MKIAVHITFFYVEKRLGYLKEVVNNLLQIDADINIFIYTNSKFELFQNFENVKILVYPYTRKGIKFFYNIFSKLGLRKLLHPYYLTWENRKIVEKEINNYDAQIYLEDDIKFTGANLNYWLKHHEAVPKKGYNLGFLRVEFEEVEKFLTDLTQPLNNMITIDKAKYIVNDDNPYCGFWIYSKEELKEFIISKEWRFKIKKYGIRAKTAIGWHGKDMHRYKGTIIPLKEEGNRYVTENDCTVHHLPNNYLDHEAFCTIEFPLIFPKKEEHNQVGG